MATSEATSGKTAKDGASPLVSVIIPSRNRKSLLARAVKSIADQGYENIEIIIIDNFSDRPIQAEDFDCARSVKVVRNTEAKLASVNRNLGVDRSQGDLVTFLDDDDTYTPVKIRQCVNALLADPDLDFVWGNTRQVDKNGETLRISSGPHDLEQFLRWRYISANAPVIRRDVFNRVRFKEEMARYEDIEMTGRLMREFKGGHIDEVHSFWLRDRRPDQLSNRNLRRAYENWARLCQTFEPEIRASGALSKYYYGRLFALSVYARDLPRAWTSLIRYAAGYFNA